MKFKSRNEDQVREHKHEIPKSTEDHKKSSNKSLLETNTIFDGFGRPKDKAVDLSNNTDN